MIKRLIQQNSSIELFKFIRSVSSIQNLCTNYSVNKLNESISNEIITGTNQLAKEDIKKQAKSKRLAQLTMTLRFRRLLRCTEEEANRIIKENKKLIEVESSKISDTIEFLQKNDVTIKSIINNPWLLTIDKSM